MNAKFQIEERSCQEKIPRVFQKAMRTAKDAGGARLYESAKFLTAQQIADYFSRQAGKRNTDENTQMTTKKKLPVWKIRPTRLQLMREKVLTNVLIQNVHPIVYDAYNICELVEKSKLSSLYMYIRILMLQQICFSFGLDTSNIALKRRKQPYTDILTDLKRSCKYSCSSETYYTRGCIGLYHILYKRRSSHLKWNEIMNVDGRESKRGRFFVSWFPNFLSRTNSSLEGCFRIKCLIALLYTLKNFTVYFTLFSFTVYKH